MGRGYRRYAANGYTKNMAHTHSDSGATNGSNDNGLLPPSGHSHTGHTHGHGHGHLHGGGHHADRTMTGSKQHTRRLALTLGLTVSYMIAEIIGARISGSLALMADATHMFSDAAALALSLFAVWFAHRPAGSQKTFGYYRTEILAAMINGAALVTIALTIFKSAYDRALAPPHVQGQLMLAVATGGLVVNIAGLFILHGGRGTSLNMEGAWLHVLSDALGSVGAMASGACIWAFGWMWVDPLASVIIGALVIYSAWSLLKEALSVLMEAAPRHINVDQVRDAMLAVNGVKEVHDLHVWTITSGLESLSAHMVVHAGVSQNETLTCTREALREKFGITHVTLQIEPEGYDEHVTCVTC